MNLLFDYDFPCETNEPFTQKVYEVAPTQMEKLGKKAGLLLACLEFDQKVPGIGSNPKCGSFAYSSRRLVMYAFMLKLFLTTFVLRFMILNQ